MSSPDAGKPATHRLQEGVAQRLVQRRHDKDARGLIQPGELRSALNGSSPVHSVQIDSSGRTWRTDDDQPTPPRQSRAPDSVSCRRCAGSSPTRPSLSMPMRVRMPETVEGALPRISAISGPLKRNLHSAAIARAALGCGAGSSSAPRSGPSARAHPRRVGRVHKPRKRDHGSRVASQRLRGTSSRNSALRAKARRQDSGEAA